MCVSVGEIRGRDQLAVSGSLRWFPVSERRKKSMFVCQDIHFFFFYMVCICVHTCVWR